MRKPLQLNTTEYRDIKKKKCCRGSITMEAAIFLTLFILFYMAMMDLIQIAKAQVLLQYSINEVAKEVSVYSYVLTKTGITGKRLNTSEQANEFVGKTTAVVDAIGKVSSTLSSGDAVGTFSAVENAGTAVQDFAGEVDELPENILSLLKTAGADMASDFAIEEVAKAEVRKQIEMMSGKDPDRFLQDLGIVGGFNGLDFSDSKWANEKEGEIPVLEIAVTYTIDYNLGYLELEPRQYKLVAKTGIW